MNTNSYTNWYTVDNETLNIWDSVINNLRQLPYSDLVAVDAQWQHNLPGLAQQYLGSMYLWWAVLMYNGLYDPIDDIVPGVVLKIPDKSSLSSLLGSVQVSGDQRYFL